jgi:AcrR family transcriptional regulator
MAVSRRAPRRTTSEVRGLILDAATGLFAEHGYAQTSMRDIATRAGISLSVLYRQFDGKEELFSATLLAPFLETFEEFAAAWRDQVEAPWDDERLVREFVRDLYRNTAEHRHSLVTLLAAGEDATSKLLSDTRERLAGGLNELRLMAEHEADRREWLRRETLAYSNSLIIAMVVGAVLLQPLLEGTLADDDNGMIDAATRMAMYGMSLTPRV